MSRLNSSQLKDLFWMKLTDFQRYSCCYNCAGYHSILYHKLFPYSDPAACVMKAVVGLGRQPKSEVLVFGPEVHLTTEGEIIQLDDLQYEWVLPIVDKLSVLPTSYPLLRAIPQHKSPLEMLLKALRMLSQKNFFPAVYILGTFATSLTMF